MKYAIAIRYDATQWVKVEAESPKDAAEKAFAKAGVSLCNKCSKELEVGEILGCMVLTDEGEIVFEEII